jgi:tripartite-type tricarboxylate transporter receptor subunit TctC
MNSRFPRRFFVTALIAIAACFSQLGHANEFPSREIKLLCGFAPGSGADITYRFLAEKLRPLVGKPVIVENRPGVQGYIAASELAKSKPDGHTIMLAGGSGLSAVKFLFKNPPVDPLKDFEYVGSLLKQGWYLSVDAKSPIKSIPELTTHLRLKGNAASYATSTNIGTVFAELYKQAAGVHPLRVNYKTVGDALNDLASGHVDMAMTDPPFTTGNVRNGRLRALAVSTGIRVAATPDVPTMAEFGFNNIDFAIWWSIQVAAGTPGPIRDQIARWFEAVLKMEDTQNFFASIGSDVFFSSPEQTRAQILKDMDKWRNYVKEAKIEPM